MFLTFLLPGEEGARQQVVVTLEWKWRPMKSALPFTSNEPGSSHHQLSGLSGAD